MAKTYVVSVRDKVYNEKEPSDYISIHTEEEALKNNWIDASGNRVWVVPAKDELSNTNVWGFDDPDEAVAFYSMLTNHAIGIKTVAV